MASIYKQIVERIENKEYLSDEQIQQLKNFMFENRPHTLRAKCDFRGVNGICNRNCVEKEGVTRCFSHVGKNSMVKCKFCEYGTRSKYLVCNRCPESKIDYVIQQNTAYKPIEKTHCVLCKCDVTYMDIHIKSAKHKRRSLAIEAMKQETN